MYEFAEKFRTMWRKEYEHRVNKHIKDNNIDINALEGITRKKQTLTWKVDENGKIY